MDHIINLKDFEGFTIKQLLASQSNEKTNKSLYVFITILPEDKYFVVENNKEVVFDGKNFVDAIRTYNSL